jgi:hypothetical protein
VQVEAQIHCTIVMFPLHHSLVRVCSFRCDDSQAMSDLLELEIDECRSNVFGQITTLCDGRSRRLRVIVVLDG